MTEHRTLRPGCKPGDDVKHAETMLHALGLFKRRPGRRYGRPAQDAVKAFKKAHGLPHDRILGPAAWKALEAAHAAHRAPMPAEGFDVSAFQGSVDFSKAFRAGRDFVYVKATEGQNFTDAHFRGNVAAARAAGMHVGAYHFLRPRSGRTGSVEAEWFMKQLHRAGLGKGDLRPVLDVEVTDLGTALLPDTTPTGDGYMGQYYHDDRGRTPERGSIAANMTEQYVRSAVDALKVNGYDPIIYTFPAFMHWSSTLGCDLWVANFGVKEPTIPAPWHKYVMWQHSSTATVPGVNGHCDVDHAPDLKALIA